jgi:hypothetical protein
MDGRTGRRAAVRYRLNSAIAAPGEIEALTYVPYQSPVALVPFGELGYPDVLPTARTSVKYSSYFSMVSSHGVASVRE